MASTRLLICNKLGLHARAASKFVETANRFSSSITVTKADKSVNGKSIMSVMMLAASIGTELTLDAEGSDADAAIAAITELVNNKFDEGE